LATKPAVPTKTLRFSGKGTFAMWIPENKRRACQALGSNDSTGETTKKKVRRRGQRHKQEYVEYGRKAAANMRNRRRRMKNSNKVRKNRGRVEGGVGICVGENCNTRCSGVHLGKTRVYRGEGKGEGQAGSSRTKNRVVKRGSGGKQSHPSGGGKRENEQKDI